MRNYGRVRRTDTDKSKRLGRDQSPLLLFQIGYPYFFESSPLK